MKTRSTSVRSRALVGVAASLVMLAACGGDTTTGAGAGSAPVDAAAAADRGAHFRMAMSFGMNSLDPHRPINTADKIWMRPIYDRLLTLAETPDGVALAPQLATSYEVPPDGMSISFALRDGVTFQDGTPFTADAVAKNVERATGPESTIASQLTSIERVEVVDPTHVVFHLNRPDPGLLWTLADGTAGMVVSPAAFAGDLRTHPVGSGPYRLVSAAKDADVVYERWDGHWDPDAALAQRLTISTVPDPNARFNAVRSGQFHAAYLSPPTDVTSRSLESQGFHWEQALSPVSYGVLLNTGMEPFDDVRVRRAVSMAIDRPRISQEVLRGINPPSYQTFNNGFLGHDPALDSNPYDPAAARALIREAGAEGATVNITQYTNPPHNTLAQIVQQALVDIGLKVELSPISPTEGLPNWRRGQAQAQVSTVVAYAEPAQTLLNTYLGVDDPGPEDPTLATMAASAQRLPVGSAEREKAYQDIGAYLIENPIHVPIAQFSTVVLTRPEVVGSDTLLVQDIDKIDFRGVGVASL